MSLLAICFTLVSCLTYSSTLNTEATCSSETLFARWYNSPYPPLWEPQILHTLIVSSYSPDTPSVLFASGFPTKALHAFLFSPIRGGLISLWRYKENNKLGSWKKWIYSTYSPLSSTHLWLRCSTFFNPPKKNYFGCVANRKIGNRKSQRLISTLRTCYFHCSLHRPWLDDSSNIGEGYKLWSSSLCSFLQPPVTSTAASPNISLSNVLTRLCTSLCLRNKLSDPYQTTVKIKSFYILTLMFWGAWGSVVGWGTMLRAGSSRFDSRWD
jgi:hypothetical protein